MVLCGLAALLATTAVRAAAPAANGDNIQAAFGVGYARPFGNLAAGDDHLLPKLFSHQIPFTVEVGAKLHARWYLGVTGSVALGGAGAPAASDCDDAADCSVTAYRFGAKLAFFFRPGQRLNPWLAVGAGYDFSQLLIDEARGKLTVEVRGYELPRLYFGADYRVCRFFGFGPYVQSAFGVYTHHRVETPRYERDEPIQDTELHGWLSAGLRMVLMP